MQIYLSDDMIHVTAGLLRRLDHEALEAVQFGETNGHGAANFFERLEEALIRFQANTPDEQLGLPTKLSLL